MKICKICNFPKDIKDFGKSKKSKDGLDSYCKSCRSEYYKDRNYDRKEYQSKYSRKITKERKEYLAKYLKEYSKTHKRKTRISPDKQRIKNLLWRVLSYRKSSKVTSTNKLLGWTKEDFIVKFGDIPKSYHVDHKIPISWFKENTPINIINSLENLQVLPSKDNLSKGNRFASSISGDFMIIITPYLKEEHAL